MVVEVLKAKNRTKAVAIIALAAKRTFEAAESSGDADEYWLTLHHPLAQFTQLDDVTRERCNDAITAAARDVYSADQSYWIKGVRVVPDVKATPKWDEEAVQWLRGHRSDSKERPGELPPAATSNDD